MDKYERLKNQVISEGEWAIETINKRNEESDIYGQIPKDLSLMEFVGNPAYDFLTDYERGMLFAYLSLKSSVTIIETSEEEKGD